MKCGRTGLGEIGHRIVTVTSLTAALAVLVATERAGAGTDVAFAGTSIGRIHRVDLLTGNIYWTRQIGEVSVAPIHALEASEDGHYLVVGSDNEVALFSTQGVELYMDPVGVQTETTVGIRTARTQVAIDSTGETFAAILNDGSLRIYHRGDTVTEPVWTSEEFEFRSVAMNEGGTTVVAAGSEAYVAKAGTDGIWGSPDDSYYTYSNASSPGPYATVDVSWTERSNGQSVVVVGSAAGSRAVVFKADDWNDGGPQFLWDYDSDRTGRMVVAIDSAPNYVVTANDNPTAGNGAKLDVLDVNSGALLWTLDPSANQSNDFRDIDLKTDSNGHAYFASGGSGDAAIFEHEATNSTPEWTGNPVWERDRISYLLWRYVVTCDINHPKVIVYDPDGNAGPLHQVDTEGDCRAICTTTVTSQPGTQYCFGDGGGTSCPCGNNGEPGFGCANGQYASGAHLDGTGSASLGSDTLILHGSNTEHMQSGLYFQADNDLSPGIVWGDGLLCTGGALKRLGVRFSDGTGYSNTSGWATPISVKAGNVMAGDTKYYQLWYRNPLNSPCGSQFNASNGLRVTWTP